MFRSTALIAALGVAGGIAIGSAAAATSTDFSSALASQGNPLISTILARWERVAQDRQMSVGLWREQTAAMLSTVSPQLLAKIAALEAPADDQIRPAAFQKLMRDAIADLASQRSGQASTLKLGSNDADLVFQPTAPCRIVDTRNASPVSGTIAAGTHRDFYGYATGGTYDWGTNQGGTPGQASASCPDTIVPCVSGTLCVSRVKAMLATVTVVSPTAAGNLIAWTGSGTAPTTSILNFSTGDVLANTTVIPIASSRDVIVPVTTKDFAIAYNGPTGQANVVVDVHGYFTASNQTALSCTREDATGGTTIANNTRYTLNAPSCTSPDREMTTYCWYLGAAPLGVAVVENAPGYCVFLNASGGSISGTNFRASSNCCHIPGLAP